VEQATVQTACFVAGTPVRLRYGCKPIEQVQKGDRVLSRDQYNPSGPVVEQVVEETFIRTAPVIRLRVCGQELRPTGEHPFYVPGRGWVLAWSLRPGDVLHTLEGEAVRVERVEDKGEVERVYNVRVRQLQTYFVGDEVWGFAIWSHNTNGHEAGTQTSASTQSILTSAAQRAYGTVGAGRGPVYGTKVHSAFRNEVNALGNTNLHTEVSYLNGVEVPYGTPGSVRIDVVEGLRSAPSAVYDLKTGNATLTRARIAEIQQHIPGGTNVPIVEIR
jgi:hypothetical protein